MHISNIARTISTRVGPADDYAELAQVFRDVRDGEAAVFEVDEDRDPRLVRWLQEQATTAEAARDSDLADQLVGIAACIERALARRRRRNREEMDALSAEANPD